MGREQKAKQWKQKYMVLDQVSAWKNKFEMRIIYGAYFAVAIASIMLYPYLADVITGYYTSEREVDGLRNMLLGIGGALGSASAVIASIVLFAMKVNLERMPHSLYHRLRYERISGNILILAALGSIVIAFSSTLMNQERLAIITVVSTLMIGLVIILLFHVFQRTVDYISPLRQLWHLVEDNNKTMKAWAKKVEREKFLVEIDAEEKGRMESLYDGNYDQTRAKFFRDRKGWDYDTKRAVSEAISLSQIYVEKGDYDVSGEALGAIVALNRIYIDVRGNTFRPGSAAVEEWDDGGMVLNHTLEEMMRNIQYGAAHGNEKQIQQTLLTMVSLIKEYVTVDYAIRKLPKCHAQLIFTQIATAVNKILSHNMAGVVAEGLWLMGKSAKYFLASGDVGYTKTISEKIAEISIGCGEQRDHHSNVYGGMLQLTCITASLLSSEDDWVKRVVPEIPRTVASVGLSFLEASSASNENIYRNFLSSYYSGNNPESLMSRLKDFADRVSRKEVSDAEAHTIMSNIAMWGILLDRIEGKLLLKAINKMSLFTNDIIHWITGVMTIQLKLANEKVCSAEIQTQLCKNAESLISTLDLIPEKENVVCFVERFKMTEVLLMTTTENNYPNSKDEIRNVTRKTQKVLLNWSFKAGKFDRTSGVLTRGLCALAKLAVDEGEEGTSWLKAEINALLASDETLDREILNRASQEILERSASLGRIASWKSPIEKANTGSEDHRELHALLEEISSLLSTSTT